MALPIPIYIGYDPRERAATNVLIDSLYQHSSIPLAITPLVTPQLEAQGLFRRQRDPKEQGSVDRPRDRRWLRAQHRYRKRVSYWYVRPGRFSTSHAV